MKWLAVGVVAFVLLRRYAKTLPEPEPFNIPLSNGEW